MHAIADDEEGECTDCGASTGRHPRLVTMLGGAEICGDCLEERMGDGWEDGE
jgi:hypothetical protein